MNLNVNDQRDAISILAIISSPHRNGDSATLARNCLNQTEKLGAKVETIYLPDYELDYCHGCMSCLKIDGCVLNDALNEIREKILNAHGLILSSPSYGLNPNAMMMNFMQRIGLYNVYRSAFREKYVVGISTAGGVGANKVARNLSKFADGLFENGKRVGHLGAKVGDGLKAKDIKSATKLGEKLYLAINQSKSYPLRGFVMKIAKSLFIKPLMKKNLEKNKDGKMKAVYNYVVENHVI